MPDILINYYRKDIVCNEDEQKNFKAKYNQKLPCTREEMDDIDWDTFEKMGEFFMRKKGDNARRQARWTTISTASPIRPAKATTSRRCRSTASSGRWRRHLGRDQGARQAMPKAS